MKSLSYYRRLPDFMESDTLVEEFSFLFKCYDEAMSQDYLDSLFELSLRKENLELELNDLMIAKANKIIKECWDSESLENTETCIMIIFNLELKESFLHMKNKFHSVRNTVVKQELDDAFNDARNSPPPVKNW